MFNEIYSYFTGFVTVRLKTCQTERFLNLAVINNIYLWNLRRISEREIIFNVSPKGFKKLRKPVYRVRGRAKIINKQGFYILLKRLKRKKAALITLFSFLIITMFLSSLILDIEITGNETVPDKIIFEKLQEIDLQKFKFRSNIDNDKVSLKLIGDLDNISWVGVYEKGTKLLIEIKERRLPPEMIPLDIPCHIIADKDGVIKKMNIKNGEPLISLNQVVTKNQVLVSGILATREDGLRYVHSMADIIAATRYENTLEVKLYEYKKSYTQKEKTKVLFKIASKEFDLSFLTDIPYYNYDEDSKRHIFGFFEIILKKYREYTLSKSPISNEEAIKRGKDALICDLYKEYDKELVKKVDFSVKPLDDESIIIKIAADIEEDIGKELIIERNN